MLAQSVIQICRNHLQIYLGLVAAEFGAYTKCAVLSARIAAQEFSLILCEGLILDSIFAFHELD